MHKAILNLFGFLKSCVQLVKVILVFCMLMLILYWIQNLTGDYWFWFSFMNRFFDLFLDAGKQIWSGSVMFWGAVFEFKFLVAMLIFGLLYLIAHIVYIAIGGLEALYGSGRKMVRKFEEDSFNNYLEKQTVYEQKKINRYQIYVELQLKPKYAHREYNIDMEEQKRILVEHLVKKTSCYPDQMGNGFVFTFDSFNHIDATLDIFSKIFQSTAPVDYVVCVQILNANSSSHAEQLQTLIDLRILNKITMLAETAYRYGFNDICKYNTVQVGLFQKGKGSFEVHEFVKND